MNWSNSLGSFPLSSRIFFIDDEIDEFFSVVVLLL
jgi:hypothetical protein